MQTELIECFRDTQRMVKENRALRRATRSMQAGTLLYLPGYEAISPVLRSQGAPLRVLGDTTFHCAQAFSDRGRTAVLNFANAYNPGGGVLHGAMAQEECLCRSSNLYFALTLPYLLRNYYKHNARTIGDLGTDSVIYSPGVTVFKSDDPVPMPIPVPFQVDVLTCAAPYVDPDRRKPIPREKLGEALTGRIRNILEVASAHEVEFLVLGAFGCGAFNNPPELVARVFRALLREERMADRFREVVFAIKPGGASENNLRVFSRILGEEGGFPGEGT